MRRLRRAIREANKAAKHFFCNVSSSNGGKKREAIDAYDYERVHTLKKLKRVRQTISSKLCCYRWGRQ